MADAKCWDGGCRDTEGARMPGRQAPGTVGTGNAEDAVTPRVPERQESGRLERWVLAWRLLT